MDGAATRATIYSNGRANRGRAGRENYDPANNYSSQEQDPEWTVDLSGSFKLVDISEEQNMGTWPRAPAAPLPRGARGPERTGGDNSEASQGTIIVLYSVYVERSNKD